MINKMKCVYQSVYYYFVLQEIYNLNLQIGDGAGDDSHARKYILPSLRYVSFTRGYI